jgi:hypothetical protein
MAEIKAAGKGDITHYPEIEFYNFVLKAKNKTIKMMLHNEK